MMNPLITILVLIFLCKGCTIEENLQIKQINYICTALSKNYLKMSQFDGYEVWHKPHADHQTIEFFYAQPKHSGQISFYPHTKLLECKKEEMLYVLSEIDPLSRHKTPRLSLKVAL